MCICMNVCMHVYIYIYVYIYICIHIIINTHRRSALETGGAAGTANNPKTSNEDTERSNTLGDEGRAQECTRNNQDVTSVKPEQK